MSVPTYCNLETLYQTEFPYQFFCDFVGNIRVKYKEAFEIAHGLCGFPRARDLLPYLRRAMVEELLWTVGSRYQGLDAEGFNLNVARNSYHVEVRSPSLIITTNAVNSPKEMVREARFRTTLAEGNQMVMFPELEDRPRGDYYYATILHGANPETPAEVDFVELAFPSHNPLAKAYLGGSPFDLAAYCKNKTVEVSEERIKDEAEPRLLSQKQVQGD